MSIIELFKEFKETEDFKEIYENLCKDNPEMIPTSLQLSCYIWWHEKHYKEICEKEGKEFKSLLDETNIEIPELLGGEIKGVGCYKEEEWKEEFKTLKPIAGQSELKMLKPDEQFDTFLPNLEM
jgi:hypothetical protein